MALRRLESLATRLARRLRSERPVDALSANKIGVLSHLHRHGPSTPSEVAAAEHQQPQSLTRVFADLARAGMVSRNRIERDGCESLLHLATASQAALEQDMAERDRWLEAALAELTETEVEVLRIAGALMDRVADGTPAARADSGGA